MGFRVATRRVMGRGGFTVWKASAGSPPPPPGLTYAQEVAADSPIAWWRLGEPSGTSAADTAGSHTGTYTAGVTLGSASALPHDANTSARFSTGAVTIPDASDIRFTGSAMTVEAWIEPDNVATASQHVCGFYDPPNSTGWGFGLSLITPNKISFFAGNWNTSTGSIPADGLWHHIAATVSAGTAITFYIDGVASGTGSGVGITAFTGPKRIGQRNDGGQQYVGGIDEVALYATELSAGRVAAHYAAA